MDASDPELLQEISSLLAKHRKDNWIDIHHLRAWRSGDRVHIDFHLILPRDLTLDEAHHEVSDLQHMLNVHLAGTADALIHAEPCRDPECPICGHDPCRLRREATQHQRLWHREKLTCGSREERPPLDSDGVRKSDPYE